jgi:hypothetical protein
VTIVATPSTHFRFEDVGSSLQVQIASPKRWGAIGLSVVQLLMLAFLTIAGVFTFLPSALKGQQDSFIFFVAVFLIVWAVGSLTRLLTLAWDFVGSETLEISNYSFIIRHTIFGLGDSAEYIAEYIKDLRTSAWNKPYDNRVRNPFIFKLAWLSDNPLSFDYGAKTIRFGNNIEEAEAKQIVSLIQQRFPQYR